MTTKASSRFERFNINVGFAKSALGLLGDVVFGSSNFIQRVDEPGHRKTRADASKDVNKLVPRRTWKALQSHGRYIYQNFGPVCGACHEKSNFAIGNGWNFFSASEDDDWAEDADKALNGWARIGDVRGLPYDFKRNMWLGSVALEHSGDFFILLTTNRHGFPRYQIIPSHRCHSGRTGDGLIRDGRFKGGKIENGVIYSKRNEIPVAYRINNPDGTHRDISARSIYPVYDPRWFGQGRGIPLLAASLGDWDDVFEILDSAKVGLEANAALAIVEYNETGSVDTSNQYIKGDGSGETVDAVKKAVAEAGSGSEVEVEVEETPPEFYHEIMEKGAIRYIQAGQGNKIEAHSFSRGEASLIAFCEAVKRGAYNGMDWAYEFGHDMSKLNSAGIRGVLSKITRSVQQRQQVLFPYARLAGAYSTARLIDLGQLEFREDFWEIDVSFPALPSIDHQHDGKADRENIRFGLDSFTGTSARSGRVWKRTIRKRFKEEQFLDEMEKETGIDRRRIVDMSPGGNAQVTMMSEEPKQKTNAEED